MYPVWTISQSLSFSVHCPFKLQSPVTDPLSVFFLKLVGGYGGQVSMELEDSPAFLAVPVEKNEESHCICGNGRKTVSWAVTLKSLGEW